MMLLNPDLQRWMCPTSEMGKPVSETRECHFVSHIFNKEEKDANSPWICQAEQILSVMDPKASYNLAWKLLADQLRERGQTVLLKNYKNKVVITPWQI